MFGQGASCSADEGYAVPSTGSNGSMDASLGKFLPIVNLFITNYQLTLSNSMHGPTDMIALDMCMRCETASLATYPAAVSCSAKKLWGAGGGGSGDGSNLLYTAMIRAALPAFIEKYKIRSMLDSSCGSMHWMPLVLRQVQDKDEEFKFMGTDVACSQIERHKVTFKVNKTMRFEVRRA
jgi:hypothetical protein